jgi:hypothetical protein
VTAQVSNDGDELVAPMTTEQVPVARPGGPLVRARTSQSVVDLARANAAERTGSTLDQVAVVSVQPTEWPDFSLGCTGTAHFVFADVIIPGYVVELDVAGTRLTYHTDGGMRAILCDGGPGSSPDPGN